MGSKKQKTNKQGIKNSFIDIKIEFWANPYFKYDVKERDVRNSNRFVRFDLKPLEMKQEIKLNDYLKQVLSAFYRFEVDEKSVDAINIKYNKYDRTLEYIGKDGLMPTILFKNQIKKNCNDDQNKITIKLIKCLMIVFIGIKKFDSTHLYTDSIGGYDSYGFNSFLGGKSKEHELWNHYVTYETLSCTSGPWPLYYNKIPNKNDTIGLKYDTIKGSLEIFINNISQGIMYDNIDTSQKYLFGITLHNVGDKIQIIE